MPNYSILNDNAITYTVDNGNHVITLVKDPNMIAGSARWDTFDTGYIYYNLPAYSKIIEISETLSQIYDQYINRGIFKEVPTPSTSLPKWATYNPEEKSYYIRFDYVMSVSVDYSSIPTCKFFTASHNFFKSKDYHYANSSIGDICSHKELVSKNQNVSYCPYSDDIFGSSPQHNCSYYSADTEVLKVINLTSKFAEANKINITVSKSRMQLGKNIQILFYDEINKTEFHKISFDSLDQDQLDSIPQNVQNIIDEIISSYENDFIIESEDITSQSVILKKKSFISSLVETDNNDVYI